MEPFTASASLAVIHTASKYLHNDLARAIKAFEQKKKSSICLMPIFGVGKVYRIWTSKRVLPSSARDVCVILPAFCGFMVSGELLKQLGVRASSQPQKQDCHTLQCVDLARPFLVLPAIKNEIENKQVSSWPSWYCDTLVSRTDCRWWFDSPLVRE